MMQIAAEKNCWLSDLDDVPAEELMMWAAYYELEKERIDKVKRRAELEAKRGL